jgi:hypothetical protein
LGKTLSMNGCPTSSSRVMPCTSIDCCDSGARIDQLVEALMTQQPTIDDPRRPDLDDLVALRRLQTSRFGIEDGIAQLHQRAIVEFMAGSRPAEDIEIIEFGTLTLACGDDRPRQILRRLGGRQHGAEKGTMRNPLALKPDLAVAAFDHIEHAEWR